MDIMVLALSKPNPRMESSRRIGGMIASRIVCGDMDIVRFRHGMHHQRVVVLRPHRRLGTHPDNGVTDAGAMIMGHMVGLLVVVMTGSRCNSNSSGGYRNRISLVLSKIYRRCDLLSSSPNKQEFFWDFRKRDEKLFVGCSP